MDGRLMASPSPPFLNGGIKKLFIDGMCVEAVSGGIFETVNPATGQVIAQVAEGGEAGVDQAVAVARQAFDGAWSRFKPFNRHAVMLGIADLIERDFDELSLLDTLDMGTSLSRTRAYKRWMLQTFRFYAGRATSIYGETGSNSVPGDFFSYTTKQPIGAVGSILPWNEPILSQRFSICPTSATGCTLVLKPAEEAPTSTPRFAQLMQEAGVPDGVINGVPGQGAVAGARLASHPDVDKIAFTGSTATGRAVVKMAADTKKRVGVELGGKSPDIVFADADLEAAAAGAGAGCFNNTGQVCDAGMPIFVPCRVVDEFTEGLAAFGRSLKVGNGLDADVQLGPLVSAEQLATVSDHLGIARAEGARVASSGERLGSALADGYFVPPTVLADGSNDMRVAQEETFGPVASVMPFDTIEDAIRLGNLTSYGLGGAVWTRDLSTAHSMSQAIRAGRVWINCYGVTEPTMNYEGLGMSGYGPRGGRRHLDEYNYAKTVWLKVQ